MGDWESRNFDAIVVGTGPGGATAARELTRRGQSVLMLEWGPDGPVRGDFRQYLTQLLVPGKSLFISEGLLGTVRGVTTGGSSLFFYGTAFPPPFAMFRRYGIDIEDEIREARAELPIAPLAGEMLTPMARRLMDAGRQSGFAWDSLDKFMRADRWRPGLPFGYYGDPHSVKWSAREFVDEALAGGAAIVNGARVTRVLTEDGAASGVEFVLGGQTRTVRAGTVIVAAGGLGSPGILRASGIEGCGRDFFFDPLITVCGTIRDVSCGPAEIPMSAGLHLEDEGYVMTDMPVTRATHIVMTAQVLRLHRLFAFGSTARIMIKIRDDLGGRITAGGGIRKPLTAADKDKFRHGFENARKVLRAAGATDIYKSWYLASHPGGSVKLGEFVDADLKTRIDGLYVCDCSVVPEAWGLPPVLALIGLGKHLVRRMTGEKPAMSEVRSA